MTADSTSLPGESPAGRHRAARLHPLGIEVHHLLARAGYPFGATHTHHSLEITA